MTKKLLFVFSTLALAVASAASYRVTFFQPAVINGTELKPGDYKVKVENNKAIIISGRKSIEADVKVETTDTKFNSTSVRYSNGDGKYRVQEIRIGGTNTKLVFN
jgi:hypothetical protein